NLTRTDSANTNAVFSPSSTLPMQIHQDLA
ncbi:MAG: hypothetical protein ACI9UU_003474, partial [Candidatus Azotimanducaceae bacterium]